jgi:hypothetical protein
LSEGFYLDSTNFPQRNQTSKYSLIENILHTSTTMSYGNMNNSGYGNNMNNSNMQGQRTGGAGKGPDMICKSKSPPQLPLPTPDHHEANSNIVLDKLEHKFGGQRFNDPANDAKNRALNQKLARRIMTIAPKVL